MSKRVLVVSARMGAGHDGAAQEICNRLERHGYVTKIVDFLDASPRAGRFLYDTYHFQMEKTPWSYGAMYWAWSKFKFLTKATTLALGGLFEKELRRWATEFEADAVITTYPFASVVLGRARRKRRNPLEIPAITFLTDFAVHPLWVHDGIDEHVCVSPSAASGVRHLLRSPRLSISGPFVPERFFEIQNKAELREQLGLPSDQIAVVLSAGSWGVGDIEHTYRELALTQGVYPILICGRNEELFNKLQGVPGGRVLGWTTQMAEILAASDAVIQNAGGLTALEAFASGTPVVSYKPIAGHGRDNTKRMQLSGVTLFARTRGDLLPVLQQAVAHSSTLTAAALALFEPQPEARLIEAIEETKPYPSTKAREPIQPSKLLARTALAVTTFFVGANVVAGVVGGNGLNIDKAAAHLPYIYLAVLPSSKSISNKALQDTLIQNDVAAVIPLNLAKAQPSSVKKLADNGITIVNGGSTTDQDIHLLLPQNAMSGDQALLENITGSQIQIYLPQEQVNSVDFAWAAIHHQVIPKVHIATSFNKVPLVPGDTVYEINGTSMSSQQLISTIRQTLARAAQKGYVVASVTTLG